MKMMMMTDIMWPTNSETSGKSANHSDQVDQMIIQTCSFLKLPNIYF